MSCADTLASILVERIGPLIPLGKRETLARKGKMKQPLVSKGLQEELKNCWIIGTNGTSVPNAWSLYLFQSLFKGFALQYARVWLQSLLKGFTAVLVERAGGT